MNTQSMNYGDEGFRITWRSFRWLILFLVVSMFSGYAIATVQAKEKDASLGNRSPQPNKTLSCSGSKLTAWNLNVQELLENVALEGCAPDIDSVGSIGYIGSGLNGGHPWAINLKAKYKNGGTTITHLATVRAGGGTDFLPSTNSIGIVVHGPTINGICATHFNDYWIEWDAPTAIVQGGVTFTRDSMEWKLNTSDSDAVSILAAGAISCVNVTECDRENVDTWIDVDSNCPNGVFEDDWLSLFVHTLQQG